MDTAKTTSQGNSSLINREIYCVCFPQRDGRDCLEGELAAGRRKFFSEGKRSIKLGNTQVVKGFEGKVQGKITRHGLYWKKTAGGVSLEEAFDQNRGYVVVRRDFRSVIVSRTFFDRDHAWIRSEYYEPGDAIHPRITFIPQENADVVLRIERDPSSSGPSSTELFPIPYRAGTAEQNIVNAKFGEPELVISTAEGDFCYCPKKEARGRLRTLDDIRDGTVVLMPAWEIKEGSLSCEPGEEVTGAMLPGLEEYARVKPDGTVSSISSSPAPPSSEEEDFSPGKEPLLEKGGPSETEEDLEILKAARSAAEEAEAHAADTASPAQFLPQIVKNGKPVGPQEAGNASKGAEISDGKREGFHCAYYSSGQLCYAGFWKEGRKNGLGVSFRESDHALHISKWENGQSTGPVTLFDKEGTLRYSGRFVNGKKHGAGVSFRKEDGTIFVGKWENGVPAGSGASFDKDGNLLYHGGWKDGKRHGHGTEFDGRGAIIFDGEWKDGEYYNGVLYQQLSSKEEENEESCEK